MKDAIKIKALENPLSLGGRRVKQGESISFNGVEYSSITKSASSAILTSRNTESKENYKFPQRLANGYNCIAFEGNVRSLNTETGRITTHKWKRENEHQTKLP